MNLSLWLFQSHNITRNYYHFIFISTKVGHECHSQLQSNFRENDAHSLWIFALSWLIRTLFIHTSPPPLLIRMTLTSLRANLTDGEHSEVAWLGKELSFSTLALLLVIHWPHLALRVLLVQMGCDDQHEDSPQNSTLCLQRSATNSRSESMCMLCVHWPQICVKESFSATFQCLSMLLTFYDPSGAWGVYRVWLLKAWPSWMSALTS